jgi:hypothetical protein
MIDLYIGYHQYIPPQPLETSPPAICANIADVLCVDMKSNLDAILNELMDWGKISTEWDFEKGSSRKWV